MDEIRAESWSHLQELLYEESWQESLRRFRSDRVFRGHQDAAGDLTTSLARLGGDFAALERHLLRNFRKYAHRDTTDETLWDWLALAKHHGLPTRVPDWTHSPFVALHFATAEPAVYDCDGAVWSVDYVQAARHLPATLRQILGGEGSNSFTTEMVQRAATTLAELERLAEDDDRRTSPNACCFRGSTASRAGSHASTRPAPARTASNRTARRAVVSP